MFLVCMTFFSSRVPRGKKKESLSGVLRGFPARFLDHCYSVFIPDWYQSATVTGI